jgi:PadR family transcriptional regulator PadR
MEQHGYLETWQQEYSGRLRKYYRITDLGRERLENFRTEWRDVKNMVDYIMGGVLNDPE